jgi:hypothetical protein
MAAEHAAQAAIPALDALLAENQRLRDALERIAENAEAWHGPYHPGDRFQGALSVVGDWAREALRGGDAA